MSFFLCFNNARMRLQQAAYHKMPSHNGEIYSANFKKQITDISTVLNSVGNTTQLLTSFSALDAAQQKVLLSSSLLSAQQKEQCATMAALTSANTVYTAEQISKATGVSAETLANWGLIASTDTLTFSELAEKAASDAQAKTVLEKIIAQNAEAVANGKVAASNATLSTSTGTATLATGTFTTAIKANIAALWTWMKTTPLGWLTMLAGGVAVAVKVFDALTVSIKEQKEKMEESSSAYEDAKNKLSNITTEYETQKQELDDLNAKNRDLTNEEKNRLDTLKKTTKELLIQRDLAEREEDDAQKDLAKDASDLFEKQFGKQDISEKAIGNYKKYINDKFNNDYAISFLQKNQGDLSAKIAAYEKMNKLLDEAYSAKDRENINKYKESSETLREEIFSTVQELQTQRDNISDWYATIEGTPYDKLSDEEQKMADNYIAIGNAVELAYSHLDPAAWKQMQIDSVFNTEDIEKTKEELIKMSKAGTLDESTLLSYSKLSDALKENKLSASELLQELNALAQAEMEGQASATPESPDAIKKVNGYKEDDAEVIGLIEEYQLLQEAMSDTGNVQQETYERLLSCSAKYSTAIRTENGRITVNATKLKAVAKSRQLDTKEAIRQTLALKKQEWVQWNQGIENYNGTLLENIVNTYGDIDALQAQITQYELLAGSLDDASSAFESFKNAQSTEDQDMYNTAQDAFDVLKGYSSDPENENYGKYNRDEFQEAAMLLMDNDTYKKALNAKDLEEYQKIVQGFVKSVEPLFDEKNYNSAANLFDRINEIMESGDVPKADVDWAKRLGISKEMFHALSQFGNQYDFNHKEIFEGYQLNTLDEYQSLLSDVKATQEALNECTDTTSNEYAYLSKELEEAKRKYNEFKNETAETVEGAYAEYSRLGEKSKGSFSDYLKQSMGLEDSDIMGMVDVLLDKSKSLQESLAKMHPDSEAYGLYKKQLDDINSLLGSLDFDIGSADKPRSLEEKASQYRELAEQAKQYKKALETEDVGSEAYKEAAQELERISQSMAELRDPLRLEISSNIAEIDAQISQLDAKINSLRESLSHASSSSEAHAIQMQMMGANNEKAKLEGQKSDLEKTLKVIVDDTEAVSKMDSLQGQKIEDKSFSVNVTDNASDVLDKIERTELSDKDLTVNVKVSNPTGVNISGGVNAPQPAGKPAKADGSLNAFAQGTGSNVSIPKDEKALVNELGEEGVVRNGRLIPIKGGAQLVNLKRGDIVFNHRQMEQLKKSGHTSGRGKLIGAYEEGTINAYDTGTRVDLPNLKDAATNNAAITQAKKGMKDAVKDVSDSVKDAADDTKEQFEEVFDWIERRIEKFQRLFDKWVKQAETAVTSGFITKYYKKAANAIKKELSTYGKAYSRYMKEANAVGLDERYAKKVRNGTIDIETIRAEGSKEDVAKYEELADKIQKYQEYYNKAIESTTSFVETAEELYNLPLDKAATKIERFKDAIDLLDKRLDNAIGAKKKNKLIDRQTKEEKKTLEASKLARKESRKGLNVARKALTKKSTLRGPDVSKEDKKKIRNATKGGKEVSLSLFKEGSKAYNAAVKYNEALKANKKATYECSAAQQEYNSWLVEASKLKFDNIADGYEKNVQMIGYEMDALDRRISEIEAAGKNVDRLYYESQKKVNGRTLAQYQAEKAALEESLKGIKKGTDEWHDAYDQIQQVESAISDCVKETYGLNNAINQLHFDLFDEVSESIGRIVTEQDFLRGLFAHEKSVDGETGGFTEAGVAKLGSLSASYYAARNNADRDGALLKELQDVKERGRQANGHYVLGDWEFNSLEDLQEKIDETYTKWQGDIKDTYGLESEMSDLMKERYQAELDMVKGLIDAKKEALDAEKDLHDYQRSISEKTKSISTIQKQIAAYSGDTSEEGMARLQKLQKELDDAKDDLKEMEYDRYVSDQKDMLDGLYKEYEDRTLEKTEDFMGLVQEGLGISNDNTALIAGYLEAIAKQNGYRIETTGVPGTSGDIKKDVDGAISDKASVKEAQSGTSSMPTGRTQPAAHEWGQPDGGQLMQAGGGVHKLHSAESDREAASDYIKKNARKAKKKKKEYADVNQRIFENKAKAYDGTGKVLPSDGLKGLAKKIGVEYDGAKKSDSLYKKLKSIKLPGFKKGGIARLIKENGEDGLTLARNGEGFIAPEHMGPIQELVDSVPKINELLKVERDESKKPIAVNGVELIPVKTDLMRAFEALTPERRMEMFGIAPPPIAPSQSSGMPAPNQSNVSNVVNIENVTLPSVKDADEFCDYLFKKMQTSKNYERMTQSMTIDRLNGGGRLDKYRFHGF